MFSLGSLGGGVRYAYTARAGGVSAPPYDSLNLSPRVGDEPGAVERNRREVLDRLGLSATVWLAAAHGARAAIVSAASAPDAEPEVDVLATIDAGIGLAALSADCVLVVLADPAAGVIAVAHCGRPGLLAGVVASAVATMRDLGASRMRAALGPSVCGACYEVPRAMADEVCAVVPQAAARTRDGRPALDIAAGVAAQLAAHDVEVARHVGGCTREDPSLFSYRRDAVTGRQAALVWRAP